MTVSLGILTAVIILLMFGAGQKILDNLRLNDKQAIVLLIAIAIGIAIPPINIGSHFSVSIGGFIIPFGICIYLLISCGWSRDLFRAFIGTILVAGIVYGLEWILPSKSAEDIIIDNTFLYGIVAGIVAYALGRSRRNAFVCAVFGISLAQIVQWIVNYCLNAPTMLGLGVGGAFGTYVIAILIAVGLAEFLGRAFTCAKPDEQKKQFNYETHTYDSEKNGKLVVEKPKKSATNVKAEVENKKSKASKSTAKKAIKTTAVLFLGLATIAFSLIPNLGSGNLPAASAVTTDVKSYYTVYDFIKKDRVVLVKGGKVENGDLYLSSDNKLYQICNVDENNKVAYAKFIKDEQLPEYNFKSTYKEEEVVSKGTSSVTSSKKYAEAKSNNKKYVGVYHTHNDESYLNPDGTDSVYGEGGIHDVGKAFKDNLEKLNVQVEYDPALHLPHNSGAYTRSQATAKKLLDKGVTAIFDVHRDSTPRKEYFTTVNGKQMSKVRMVIGSSNQNFAENKNFAYSIKSYADKAYPNFIKDIYMGGGNYNQQLSGFAMLFEMGSENIEKELAINSTAVLAKVVDVVLFGSDAASQASLADIDLSNGNGGKNVITGLSNEGSGASLTSLWVLLGTLGVVIVVVSLAAIFSKKARYKIARFFSELFAGLFGRKKSRNHQ